MSFPKLLLASLCLILLMSCQSTRNQEAQPSTNSLSFNPKKFQVQEIESGDQKMKIRAYEGIVYVKNPVDITYQKMNIYIPEAYFTGNSIEGYTVETAPIFFPNKIGGYMPGLPGTAVSSNRTPNRDSGFNPERRSDRGSGPGRGERPDPGMRPNPGMGRNPGQRPAPEQVPNQSVERTNTIAYALSKGFVVASPGARGRTTQDEDGTYTGKAPAGIVDLKAAVRYLKFNDENMPGDAGKIISNGTSAGGAFSTLLGATGNSKAYEPYLESLGAAPATDDIFAVSAYCPITNLENADMAYEWQFDNVYTYQGRRGNSGELESEKIEVSKDLAALFPEYVNSLKLKNKNEEFLTLDQDGNGNFKDLIASLLIASAQKALDNGLDMSSYEFLRITDSKVTNIDFDDYIEYLKRMKTPPAFDALDLSTAENQLFGNKEIDKQHFTQYSTVNSTINDATRVEENAVVLMNPMYFIGTEDATVSEHWRIRHGTKDSDTSLAISALLATLLENEGYTVNYELPWDQPHSGDYDLEELFSWINEICNK